MKAVVAVLVLLIIGVLLYMYKPMIATPITASPTVTINNTTIQVAIANTDATRQQGLSGRASLSEGYGMLFIFDTPGNYGFWMKDMNFAIDMVFIDSSGNIVTIDRNATPQSYHQTPPQVFYPASPVLYVLELPAGYAAKHGIAVGDYVQIAK